MSFQELSLPTGLPLDGVFQPRETQSKSEARLIYAMSGSRFRLTDSILTSQSGDDLHGVHALAGFSVSRQRGKGSML